LNTYIQEKYEEKRNFLLGIFIAAVITLVLSFIEIWQLVIIPGIVVGIINYKHPRKGIYSGAIGIALMWLFYMLYMMATRNAYTNIDQFAGLIFGDLGFGWVILILILLFGGLFGALGGAIGAGTMKLVKLKQENKRDTSEISKQKETPKSKTN